MNMTHSPTRGSGLLERMLAKKRIRAADELIKADLRDGNILDIGCGAYPYFLTAVKFSKKYGLDKEWNGKQIGVNEDFNIQKYSIADEHKLPFGDNFFSVVTLLAVCEHLERKAMLHLCKEVFRVLKTGGQFIITTPSPAAESILFLFEKIRLVSHEELSEHQRLYSSRELIGLLIESGFLRAYIDSGIFGLGLNIRVAAEKGGK